MEASAGKANPFRGMLVKDETYRHTTQAGREITLNSWVPVPGQTKESKAKMAARLDAGEFAETKAIAAKAQETAPKPAAPPPEPEPVADPLAELGI